MARRRHEEEESIGEGELNLVPYLDIMVNLIMFMLLTFQVMAELKIIQFNPPASADENSVGAATPDQEKKPLLLSVMILESGHRIVTDQVGMGAQEVPKKGADYDYEDLTKQLADLKKNPNTPVDENIVIVAAPEITYDVVVKTLDALRTDAKGNDLFPKVTLGLAVGSQ